MGHVRIADLYTGGLCEVTVESFGQSILDDDKAYFGRPQVTHNVRTLLPSVKSTLSARHFARNEQEPSPI